MKTSRAVTTSLILAFVIPAVPAYALGPLDAEAGVLWWSHDVETDDLGNANADGAGAYAEIWWDEGFGLAADYFESDPDFRGAGTSSDFSVDIKKRIISPTENNFLALGVGWQDTELVGGSTADGVRLTLDARIGVGILHTFGRAVWMPELGDAGIRRDLEGTEYQVGISLTPFPFFNFRLGYREYQLDYRGGSQTSDGYFLGAALHF